MRDRWRQSLHLEPPRGWMNDPNGLCWFDGLYHVFFQYCPESAVGCGPKCWGHYTSPDLLHWRFAGTALRPDTAADRDGVYSGCAVELGGQMALYYTGNVKHPGDYDYITAGREGNVLRVLSLDGFHMGEKELLLTNRDYPDSCSCHVRDPKVWQEDGQWKMVLGARDRSDRGELLVYHSSDGRRWQFTAAVQKKEPFGYMWECPDCFVLGGKTVLSVSPQGLPHEEYRFQNACQSGWFAFDGPLEFARLGEFTEWDMGFDFYAPQTFFAPDGRRLLIGWMGQPDSPYTNLTAAQGWQHCLTLPRELFWDEDGRLCQRPVREMEALEQKVRRIPDGQRALLPLPSRMKARPQGSFALHLGQNTVFAYDAAQGTAELRFLSDQTGCGRTVRRALLPRCREIEVITDASSVEIYLDGGAVVFSSRVYPETREIAMQAQGTSFELCAMKPLEVTGFEA